jgi:uncharacterized protein YdhG (YjbR/CyaY superfamily)
MKFKKVNNDLGIISYSKTDRELQVYVSGQVVLYQVMGLLSISHIRKNLRTKKRLYSHVDFVCDQYKKVLLNTIQKKLKSEVNEILVNIKEINVELRDVIAYSLYMLQALELISMSKEKELYKISLKKNLDVFLDSIQKIVSEEDNELLEFLNE